MRLFIPILSILIMSGFISCKKSKSEVPDAWKGLEGKWRPIMIDYNLKPSYLPQYDNYDQVGNKLFGSHTRLNGSYEDTFDLSWEVTTAMDADTFTIIEKYTGTKITGEKLLIHFGNNYTLVPGTYIYPNPDPNIREISISRSLDTLWLRYHTWGSSYGKSCYRTVVKIK